MTTAKHGCHQQEGTLVTAMARAAVENTMIA
jgi:hypothetical protein